jgi:hypothetical protein
MGVSTNTARVARGVLSIAALAIVLFISVQSNRVVQAQQDGWLSGTGGLYYNGGNVGIGTSSPPATTKLHVLAGTSADLNPLIENTANGYGAYLTLKGNSAFVANIIQSSDGTWAFGRFGGYNEFKVQDLTNNKQPFVIRGGAPDNSLYVTSSGNVGIGTYMPSSRLHVTGNITVDGNINAKYSQDIAEWVSASKDATSGVVVVLDPQRRNAVIPSWLPYDSRVAGVISSSPGIVLGEAEEGKAKVATTGRVKVRVDATQEPIHIGDLLVSSAKQGTAMRSMAVEVAGVKMHRPGTVIGKALEPLERGEGEILVLLSLQ